MTLTDFQGKWYNRVGDTLELNPDPSSNNLTGSYTPKYGSFAGKPVPLVGFYDRDPKTQVGDPHHYHQALSWSLIWLTQPNVTPNLRSSTGFAAQYHHEEKPEDRNLVAMFLMTPEKRPKEGDFDRQWFRFETGYYEFDRTPPQDDAEKSMACFPVPDED